MRVKFWGVRGSTPVAGPSYAKYGGHTSCVSVEVSDDLILVIDAGTGINECGEDLIKRNFTKCHLFFSHFHLDHIIGLPFFKPLWTKDFELTIYSPYFKDVEVFQQQISSTIFSHPLFPVGPEAFGARVIFKTLSITHPLDLPHLTRVYAHKLNHPGDSYGFRINALGKSCCYISDHEHVSDTIEADIVEFVKNSDLMIYDACYTQEEHALKKGWGHSTFNHGIKIAQAAEVKKLGLFHHDYTHTDIMVDHIEQEAQKLMPQAFAARQGMVLDL